MNVSLALKRSKDPAADQVKLTHSPNQESLALAGRALILAFPCFLLTAAFALKKNQPGMYFQLFNADFFNPSAPAEWAQFVFYLVAFFLARITQVHIRQSRSPSSTGLLNRCFAAFLFLVGMEEISWGQKLFQWPTPIFFQGLNRQNETTIHNLFFVQDGSWKGGLWLSPLLISFVLVGVVSGLGWTIRDRTCLRLFRFLIPPWYLASYFLLPGLYYAYLAIHPHAAMHQELFELMLSLGFLLLAVKNLFRFRVLRLRHRAPLPCGLHR